MNAEKVKEAVKHAQEFIRRAKVLHHGEGEIVGTRNSASLKRQSLELTRSLADLRRPG
jgi:hypothetical protein